MKTAENASKLSLDGPKSVERDFFGTKAAVGSDFYDFSGTDDHFNA